MVKTIYFYLYFYFILFLFYFLFFIFYFYFIFFNFFIIIDLNGDGIVTKEILLEFLKSVMKENITLKVEIDEEQMKGFIFILFYLYIILF